MFFRLAVVLHDLQNSYYLPSAYYIILYYYVNVWVHVSTICWSSMGCERHKSQNYNSQHHL